MSTDSSNNRRGITGVVLGAGATRGASFVDPKKASCIPPLDRDFFTQLQRVSHAKHRDHIGAVMKDVVRLFGTNFSATMETVFATLQHTIQMLKTTKAERAYRRRELEEMRDRLLGAIVIVMEAALTETKEGRAMRTPRHCEYHEKLVESFLRGGDHIISFNYDCVIDYALKRKGDEKWNPRYGYGFNLGPRGKNLSGDEYWMPGQPAKGEDTIKLHKLHGSLHFQFGERSASKVVLKKLPYTKMNGTPRYSIIPPESCKAYDKGVFGDLWRNAAAALGKADHLVFIGYSIPPTDLHATALFRTSIRPNQLKSLVVVNPDREARARTRTVLQQALSETTRVLSFDSFEEFLATDDRAWKV